MFENLMVGDRVLLCVPSYKNTDTGTVVEVRESTVVAQFIVDQPRKFEFAKDTGIDVLGEEYGHLLSGVNTCKVHRS
jgi:hypothetical protein